MSCILSIYKKVTTNTRRIMIKIKNLKYWDVNNLYGLVIEKASSKLF